MAVHTRLSDTGAGCRLVPLLGIVVDVVGYGQRATGRQHEIQARLCTAMARMLADVGVRPHELPFTVASGDGLFMFLPANTDPAWALPGLLRSAAVHLAESNSLSDDRIRLRMALGFGLVGSGVLGLVGGLAVELNRLVDSSVLRRAITDHPHTDLVVLVSDGLRRLVEQVDCLPALTRVAVMAKEYRRPAWLAVDPMFMT